ncbi:hypothetical protein ABXT00_09965 [Stenotrophomonas koreensis]|uniref:hypothetical protein n=1 Tax=Stenotrophomonas koreensis TaxID=266128 RepID=UPI003398B4BC
MAAATAQQWRACCHACPFLAQGQRGCVDASRLATAVELLFFRIELDRDSFFPACRKRRVFDSVMGLLFSCEDNIHLKFM